MKSIIQAMLEEIYEKADKIAKIDKQVIVGSAEDYGVLNRGSFYITLQQLGEILKEFES